jgi:hypothetical protein
MGRFAGRPAQWETARAIRLAGGKPAGSAPPALLRRFPAGKKNGKKVKKTH